MRQLHALHSDVVRWPMAWLMAGLGIIGADLVLYGVGRRWGVRLFEYRWVQRLVKPERREVDLEARYVGFEIPNRFAIGYGLDFGERYRNLPDLHVLRTQS